MYFWISLKTYEIYTYMNDFTELLNIQMLCQSLKYLLSRHIGICPVSQNIDILST